MAVDGNLITVAVPYTFLPTLISLVPSASQPALKHYIYCRRYIGSIKYSQLKRVDNENGPVFVV